MTLLEVCLDDIEGAVVAEEAGADRIELCAALSEGGVTPSLGTVAAVLDRVRRIGVQVLVRQRPGDFVHTAAEVDAMAADIEAVLALPHAPGVTVGFVIGTLTPEGLVDADATARLVGAAAGAPVTFHKAFDQTPDLGAALERLVDLGVGRVLTSAGAPSARDGAAGLRDLVGRAGDRITVLAGGGIRADHALDLVRSTGVAEVHLRAQTSVPSAALDAAGSAYDSGERLVTSREAVTAVRVALDGGRRAPADTGLRPG